MVEVESEMQRGSSQWPSQRTPEEAALTQVPMDKPSASVFGLQPVLSRVPSIESDSSELLKDVPPCMGASNAMKTQQSSQQKQHQQISRSGRFQFNRFYRLQRSITDIT